MAVNLKFCSGYPMREGALIALDEGRRAAEAGHFEQIIYVQFNVQGLHIYRDTAASLANDKSNSR